jgi:hypothetical protein
MPDEHRRRVLLEHTNPFRVDLSFVHTLRDALDLARRVDVGVCMEVNACWIERGLAESIAAGVSERLIRLVQVSDFVVGTKATPDRAVPGDGDIPLARIVDQLLAAGYTGRFDLEIIGPRIEAEGYERAVSRSLARVSELLQAADSLISSTAVSTAAAFAFDGTRYPLTLRTNCNAAARTSSSVVVSSRNGLMLRHIRDPWRRPG